VFFSIAHRYLYLIITIEVKVMKKIGLDNIDQLTYGERKTLLSILVLYFAELNDEPYMAKWKLHIILGMLKLNKQNKYYDR
jgi:hypothetical protein